MAIKRICLKTRIEAMRVERLVMRLVRMVMRGDFQKMARGETAAKAPDKKQLARQAMRMARRAGRF